MKKKFNKAWIYSDHGVLKISNKFQNSYWEKHYNVELEIDEINNTFVLKGKRANYNFNFGQLSFLDSEKLDSNLYRESAFIEKKSFWSGKVKMILKEGYLEKKETTLVTYTGNNYLIIEE